LARKERGDGTSVESLKDLREEEFMEVVVWLMDGNNQPVSSQGVIKMVVEFWEGRLGRWREEVLMEQPLEDHRKQVIGMVWQVEEAEPFCPPTVFHQMLVAGEVESYPALFLSDGSTMITICQTDQGAIPFDHHKNVGLHHLAIKVQLHRLALGKSSDQAVSHTHCH
jgi:hypothetical protein